MFYCPHFDEFTKLYEGPIHIFYIPYMDSDVWGEKLQSQMMDWGLNTSCVTCGVTLKLLPMLFFFFFKCTLHPFHSETFITVWCAQANKTASTCQKYFQDEVLGHRQYDSLVEIFLTSHL